ncbi:hypothetical protein QHZ39_002720 [Salmonella enterica]|nr:hypothetical protein [Salmonella enterica]EFR7201659.1 hypothetical protein [Salmonella enterica]EHY4775606.1 hypothetical protein [Salmonella enterica]EKY2812860.1 hypothetical protein [Salmonella enterica]
MATDKKKSPFAFVNPVTQEERDKALKTAMDAIDKQFGKGSIMRLGDESRLTVERISTGSLTLDIMLLESQGLFSGNFIT